MRIDLDHDGIAEILGSSRVASLTAAAGARMAAHLGGLTANDGTEIPVEVDEWRPQLRRDPLPRAGSAVTLAHAAGVGIERKYGVLTEAALAAGLEPGRAR